MTGKITKRVVCSTVLFLEIVFTVVGSGGVTAPSPAQARDTQASLLVPAVLTVWLRDSHGVALAGVLCEVLSYDWGRPVGQPYGIIAGGETDQHGMVAFEVGSWPRSGYRFKFSKTDHTVPLDTFFADPQVNQYRGYPAAMVGGRGEGQRFVIASDGLAYNDLAEEGQPPRYDKNPVGGLEKPRATLIASEDYLATVRAATAGAEAVGVPSPTRPPRLAATPGVPQTALIGTTPAPSPLLSTTAPSDSLAEKPSVTSTADNTPASSSTGSREENAQSLVGSILLGLTGFICFGVFWKCRGLIYPWLGIETGPSHRRKVSNPSGKRARPSSSLLFPSASTDDKDSLLKEAQPNNQKEGTDREC